MWILFSLFCPVSFPSLYDGGPRLLDARPNELMKMKSNKWREHWYRTKKKTIHRCTIFTSTIETRRQQSERLCERWAPTWRSIFECVTLHQRFPFIHSHQSFKWPTFCGFCHIHVGRCCATKPLFRSTHTHTHVRLKSQIDLLLNKIPFFPAAVNACAHKNLV